MFSHSPEMIFAVLPALVILYFLPAILAFLLNRKQKAQILAANVPAGFSWFIWFAVLVWALTGKEKSDSSTA